jgi:hypothetical protein
MPRVPTAVSVTTPASFGSSGDYDCLGRMADKLKLAPEKSQHS